MNAQTKTRNLHSHAHRVVARACALVLTLALSMGIPVAAQAGVVPISVDDITIFVPTRSFGSNTADWSYKLDDTWKCEETGARWEQWKKTVFLFAASFGYGFRAACNKVSSTNNLSYAGMLIVAFRDRANVTKAVGWYSGKLDREGRPIFGGIMPLFAHSTALPSDKWERVGWLNQLASTGPMAGSVGEPSGPSGYATSPYDARALNLYLASLPKTEGCRAPFAHCITEYIAFPISANETGHLMFKQIGSDAESLQVDFHYLRVTNSDKFVGVLVDLVIATVFAEMGAAIGEAAGLAAGSASNAAFAAGFSNFSTSIINGADVNDAFMNGLKGATVAYVGKLALDAFGDPDSKVGVSGAGCPTGDQCWYFEMANGFPPLKHLAEMHDPFIDFSVKAFGSIAESGWYKAVTILPFVPLGCAATTSCVTAGIVLTREDEGPFKMSRDDPSCRDNKSCL
jgi:hypothetical protein